MNRVLARLPYYLSKGSLKQDFLDISLSKFLGIRKFKNASAKMVISFLKMFKIECKFRICKKERENIFRFRYICIWKRCNKLRPLRREYLLSALSGLKKYRKILISLRETLPGWIAFREINKNGKGAVLQISTDFRPVYHVSCRRILWNRTFYTFI